MACDIPLLFPNAGKEVTLVHSREHNMPRFHPALHDIVMKRFAELGVKTVLGSRAIVPAEGWKAVQDGGVITLQDGRTIEGDLIVSAFLGSEGSDVGLAELGWDGSS